MSDRIFIKGLSLHAYHGVMAHEAKVGQSFSIDMELTIDLSDAARSDKVRDTVSYDKVVECASAAFMAQRFRLIEAAAGRVADAVLAAFPRSRARADCRQFRRCRGHAAPHADRQMTQALLALGGNVGDSRAVLDRAVALMCDGKEVRLTARSSDYLTPPWGVTDQPPFVNLCIAVETSLAPQALLARAQAVERTLGRDRAREQRWGPRSADIDIIAYDDLTLSEDGLILPHPRLFERAFVLVPLAEIAPDRMIAGRRIGEAAASIAAAGIERLPPRADDPGI